MTVIGAATGSISLADALREGAAAGAAAAGDMGFHAPAAPIPSCDDEQTGIAAFWHVADSTAKSFVDFQNDVTRDDVALAAREGYGSVELLKRYTTLGMGTDQGKTSNISGLAILASLAERSIPQVGTTVFRPPHTPVALGAFAGHHRAREFHPTPLTSAHEWAAGQGATFVEVGAWLRAQMFPKSGENDWLQTVSREVRSVRSSAGVCDVSTLGKIDVQGPDAGAFLDRVYTNVQHLEHARQVTWPTLDVQIVSVTEQWAQYSIAGPNARSTLERLLGSSVDLSNEAFPYQACARFSWQGIPTRIFRVSFSGDSSRRPASARIRCRRCGGHGRRAHWHALAPR